MLVNAFKRASAGSKCAKCGSIVNFSYIKRHAEECKGAIPKVVEEDGDDEIEVISENIKVAPVETSSSKVKEKDKKPAKIFATSSTAIKRPKSTDEVILLSDSDEDAAPKPKRSTSTTTDKPSTSKANDVVKPKFSRALVYANDPSAGMTLPEVYEKLMVQLENLCNAGRSGGYLIASQTNERLSSSPKKKTSLIESEAQPTTSAKAGAINDDESDKPVELNSTIKVPNTGIGFAGGYQASEHEIEGVVLEEMQEELNETNPESEPDLTDAQVVQADSKYGSSYVVRFFWMMSKRVFSKEAGIQGENAPDFWGDELRLLYWLVTMGDSEQYLFIRLCLRLRKWLTIDDLSKYATNKADIDDIAAGLIHAKLLEESTSPTASITLEEALGRLNRDDLSELARIYKVEHRLKIKDIIKNLLLISNGKDVFGRSIYPSLLINAKKQLPLCFRVTERAITMFNSILTLYCPTHMNSGLLFDPVSTAGLSSNLMFQLLQVETQKLSFCGPKDIVKCINIYPTYQELKDYMEAKRVETLMAWDKRSGKYQNMYDNGLFAVKKVKDMVETQKEHLERLVPLPHHLRRYTDFWVYVRCATHTVDAMERLRKYDEAVELLQYILQTEELIPFCPDKRGFLYDRLALDLDAHLKRKEDSLDACMRGIMDKVVRDKDRLLLQDRALRIDKFFEIVLKIDVPRSIEIVGNIIEKNIGEQKINHFYVEVDGEKEIVSVEELALRHFRQEQNFWGGMHSEGGIWHTVFGIICYDIIFDHNIDSVWFSPLQDSPADLNTLNFFLNRKEKFEERLSLLLEEGENEALLIDIMKENYLRNHGRTSSKIDWHVFETFEEFMNFMSCIRRESLAMIIKRIIEDHRHHRSGFPDLTLWDPATRRIAVIEVKGPGDKLSTKQRLWIDFFNKQGVDACVCHVIGECSAWLVRYMEENDDFPSLSFDYSEQESSNSEEDDSQEQQEDYSSTEEV